MSASSTHTDEKLAAFQLENIVTKEEESNIGLPLDNTTTSGTINEVLSNLAFSSGI